ncbi:MAG: tetratricopeptide repeat protein [Planctomycetes bacterium]|nr:tetratricopeptide repeat protein [Planctomycetota bacterium]
MPPSENRSTTISVNVEGHFDPEGLRLAIRHLEKAVALASNKARYRRLLAEAYLAARQNEAALEQLREVIGKRQEPRLQFLMALALYRLGRNDRAEIELGRINDSGVLGFSRLHILRGRILYDRHRFAEAVNEFGRALEVSQDAEAPRWHMGRALVAHAQSALSDPTNLYRRALKLLTTYTPDREELDEWHRLLGRIHLALHQPIEALEHLELSQRHSTTDEKTMLLGFALLLHGDRERSQSLLASAAKNPSLRVHVTEYLREVVSTPRELLVGMGKDAVRGDASRIVSEDFLIAVFGPRSAEAQRVIEAATRHPSQFTIRTQVELTTTPLTGGRLFATSVIDEGTSTADASAPKRPVNHDLEEPTVVSDRVFPPTHLDLTESLPLDEQSGPVPVDQPKARPNAPPPADDADQVLDEDDDWDIGLDEFLSELDDDDEARPDTNPAPERDR